MFALLFCFNLPYALWSCAVVGYLCFLANVMLGENLQSSWLPGLIQPEFPSIVDGTVSWFPQCAEAFVPPTFVLALLTSHWWPGRDATTVFLDIW